MSRTKWAPPPAVPIYLLTVRERKIERLRLQRELERDRTRLYHFNVDVRAARAFAALPAGSTTSGDHECSLFLG